MQEKTRTITITVLALLFVGSTVYLSFSPSSSQKKSSTDSDLVSILSKTSKNNTGLLDVKQGETLPNWKIAVINRAKQELPDINISNPQATDTNSLEDPNNITAQYAKNVYTATAVLDQDGNLTNKEKADVARAVFEQDLLKATAKVYGLSDIKTLESSSKDTIKKYGNALGKAVSYGFAGMGKYEDLPLLEKLASSPDQKTLTAIDQKINEVTKFRDGVLAVSAPKSAVLFHLSLVNALEAYRQTLINMRALQTDALRASIGAHDYPFVLGDVYVTTSEFIPYFNQEGVTFAKTEFGSIFNTNEATK